MSCLLQASLDAVRDNWSQGLRETCPSCVVAEILSASQRHVALTAASTHSGHLAREGSPVYLIRIALMVPCQCVSNRKAICYYGYKLSQLQLSHWGGVCIHWHRYGDQKPMLLKFSFQRLNSGLVTGGLIC